jgi:pyruvate kinase
MGEAKTRLSRRTKIIATIGPSTNNPEAIRELIKAGMNVARLNFSHGEFEEHAETISVIREQAKQLRLPVAILQDLPGPKIRIGEVKSGPVYLERGRPFVLTARDVPGNASEVHLPNSEVLSALKAGDSVFLDDGSIQLRVTGTDGTDVATVVLVPGVLSSHKGVAVPGVSLKIGSLTERDIEAARFGVMHKVDWMAASFVRSADDVNALRDVIRSAGGDVPIVAKIEKHEAVANIAGIVDAADAVMVARGDLGVEMNIWEVPTIQKAIIRRCNRLGKPVITATQMLQSMTTNRRPTRAEATDVVNAILDGTDCVMLSQETAVGSYPVEAVTMMGQLAVTAEASLRHEEILRDRLKSQARTVTDAISAAAVEIAENLDVAAILAATLSGYTARMISRYRPSAPIIGVTTDSTTYRRLCLVWGVTPLLAPEAETTDDTLDNSIVAATLAGAVTSGDTVVLTAGLPVGEAGNTNLIRVAEVE